MMRVVAVMTLFLLHSVLYAEGLDFVKPFSAIERAPLTRDAIGSMIGTPGFVRLVRPVAVGAYSGTVYLFDAGTNLFYRYNLYLETLLELPNISRVLKGVPAGITVAPDLSFYVADPAGRQVIHGSLDGQVLRILSDEANLANPIATVLDPYTNNVVVADSQYDHILGFNHDGWLLYGFGQRGMEPQQFQVIAGMAGGPQGLYVVDRLNPFIKIFTPEGKFIYGFTRREVANPAAIAVDWRDRVYVADSFDDTIKVYVKEKYVGEIGGTGSALGRFRFITNLYINQNFLYVADSMNGRVQVFVIDPNGAPKVQQKESALQPAPEQAPVTEVAPTP